MSRTITTHARLRFKARRGRVRIAIMDVHAFGTSLRAGWFL